MIPNDPLYKDQWHLHVLDMEQVWDVEIGSPDVLVAVVVVDTRRQLSAAQREAGVYSLRQSVRVRDHGD